MEMPLPQTLRRALEAAGSHKGKGAAAENDSGSKTLTNIQIANAEFGKKAVEGPREKGRKVLVTKDRSEGRAEINLVDTCATGDDESAHTAPAFRAALYVPVVPLKQGSRRKTAKNGGKRVASAGRIVPGKASRT